MDEDYRGRAGKQEGFRDLAQKLFPRARNGDGKRASDAIRIAFEIVEFD